MKLNRNNQNQGYPLSPRAELERKYNACRANLLLVTLVSFINLFMVAFSNSYFLFSASMPTLLLELVLAEAAETEMVVDISMLILPIAIGVVLTVPYLLCWIFSKKRVGWMVAALVFFSLDCIFLLTTYQISSVIIDILFHAWVMFYLITGVMHGFKLKKMPADEPVDPLAEGMTVNESSPEDAPASDGFDTFNDDAFNYAEDTAAEAEKTDDSAE